MGGNTSLRIYHSFGACVSSYFTCIKFGTSCGLFGTTVCVYETMLYGLHVPCGTLCLFTYVFCELLVYVCDGYGIIVRFLVFIIFGIPYCLTYP
jgi:hypothetical protein